MDLVELIMKQAFSDTEKLVDKINANVNIPILTEKTEKVVFTALIGVMQEVIFENLSKSK
tara:strand:+ start:109 stop:288 length:180 start_codon:yes stop_codon:yes gene_type:complete